MAIKEEIETVSRQFISISEAVNLLAELNKIDSATAGKWLSGKLEAINATKLHRPDPFFLTEASSALSGAWDFETEGYLEPNEYYRQIIQGAFFDCVQIPEVETFGYARKSLMFWLLDEGHKMQPSLLDYAQSYIPSDTPEECLQLIRNLERQNLEATKLLAEYESTSANKLTTNQKYIIATLLKMSELDRSSNNGRFTALRTFADQHNLPFPAKDCFNAFMRCIE